MRGRACAAAALAVLSLGCQNVGKLDWTDLGRESWQRPADVIDALDLADGDRVADVGAGDGYFVSYLSRAVGPDGRVFAVEVDDELTQALEDAYPDANVAVVRGAFEDPKLPDGEIDCVLLVNTFHHIEDRSAYFSRLRTDLSPDGRVAVIEPDADLGGVLSLFLTDGHTSRAADVVAEMEAAGYRKVATHGFLPVQIFEVFAVDPDVR